MAFTNPLMQLFGQSPFKPLQEHYAVVLKCANEVPALLAAAQKGNDPEIGSIRDEIFKLESEADDLKNELRSHLPRTMFLPVDRREVLMILDLQDSIADAAQDIAGMMVVRGMILPDSMYENVRVLANRCVDACNQLGKIMEEMDELVGGGFRGPEADKIMYMIDELNKIETDTDVHAVNLMKTLFAHEEELGAVSTVMWDRVIHWIGDLANYAEKAGNRHRLLLAR